MQQFTRLLTVCILGALLFLGSTPGFSQAMKVGTNFWDISWGGSDPFTNTHKNVSGTNPWRSDFLSEIAVYNGPLRFMDFGKVNDAELMHTGNWADRKQKSDPLQKPMAYEWMIDLCNRSGKDMWLCVPHNATDSYMQSLATLIKNNLNPSLKCYIEYSNEVWNAQFSQRTWVSERGIALGFDTNSYNAAAFYNAHIATRMFKIFEDVYGTEKSRLVKVISGQSGSLYYCQKVLEGLRRPDINTAGVQPDQFAVTGYIGGGMDGASPTIEADWQNVLTGVVNFHSELKTELAGTGMGLIHYEGGHHITKNSNVFAANPKSYDMYIAMLEQLSPYVSLFMHYVHSGAWGAVNAWGAKNAIGQPLADAHKYRALVDYINRDPVAPSAPGSLRSSNVASTSLTLLWNASTDNVGVTGYNVYRGTTLIGSTTTSTTFNVTGLTAGTSYTFTVRAKDAAGNLSGNSNAHTISTTGGTGSDLYEAENATLSGAVVATNNTGYTGTGFVDYGSTVGQYIQFTVSAATAGTHTLEVRYANGGTGNRPLSLSVNGTTVNSAMAFNPTGGWATWSTVSVTANLNSGSNTVRLTLTQADGPNIDNLEISRDSQAPTTPANLTSPSKTATSVNLSWTASTDNIGVAGYNIYRGTTLAGTSTGTTYTATGLSASTSYTFTVRARDAAGNLSAASNNVTVITNAAATSVTYEAESATLSGAVVATNYSGYTGTGFVDFGSTSGQYIQWTVSAAAAGTHTFEIRYANGGTANRPLSVSVNGTTVNSALAFNPTGAWTTWATTSFTANLNAGSNTVRVTLTQTSGPNVDNLKLTAGAARLQLASTQESEAGVSVQPNPATEFVKVQFQAKKAQSVTYQLSNLKGQAVLAASKQVEAGANAVTINVAGLSEGIYLLQLDVDGQKTVKKLLIKK